MLRTASHFISISLLIIESKYVFSTISTIHFTGGVREGEGSTASGVSVGEFLGSIDGPKAIMMVRMVAVYDIIASNYLCSPFFLSPPSPLNTKKMVHTK